LKTSYDSEGGKKYSAKEGSNFDQNGRPKFSENVNWGRAVQAKISTGGEETPRPLKDAAKKGDRKGLEMAPQGSGTSMGLGFNIQKWCPRGREWGP